MSEAPAPGGALQAVEEHAEAEGAVEAAESSEGVGSSSTLRKMLFSTGPEKPLDQVSTPYDPERGGVTRIYRGIQKMVDTDGLPAIADIAIGIFEAVQTLNLDDEPEDDEQADIEIDDTGDDQLGPHPMDQ